MADLEVNVDDLVELLSPNMALLVRRKTMEIVTQLGAPLDGSAGKYFQAKDFALGKAICQLCEATASDRTETLAALTNYTSGSIEAADFILKNSKCIEIAYTAVVANALYSSVASRLLVNVARHFPDRVDQKLRARSPDFITALLAEIKKAVSSGDEARAKFIGFTIVNLSILSRVRQYIVGVGKTGDNDELAPPSTTTPPLPIVYDLLASAAMPEIRECAADVLRNLAFDDERSRVSEGPEAHLNLKLPSRQTEMSRFQQPDSLKFDPSSFVILGYLYRAIWRILRILGLIQDRIATSLVCGKIQNPEDSEFQALKSLYDLPADWHQ
ncbi:hypothetical protein GCK72_008509 [Caenorhabditis remanei]|uniref:Protein HGH1 N-terminal domain-containing protein n=1 Tax=Caenorhabditis remanei TaxID=31234 RepID=A0A6A5H0U6_CAERE|nr:hypothetical protein GCK72_008509 [Caenorhabditis remanei]KAF1760263.1 hypothetical protein GCK72_008509 [Caenorhabditis remanei]